MIEYLKLTNFKRHESLELSLENGLTVLSGANEAGKSSILHAILYAMYGSRALPRSLEGTVTYGKPVASLRVELGFKVGGVLYTITRSKSGAEMSGGGVLSSGQAEVAAAVERLLGANMAAASRLLVANQGDLRGVVEKGSEAVKLIEELADLDAIEGLVEKIQNVLPTGSTSALAAQAAALGELVEPELVDLGGEISTAQADEVADGFRVSGLQADLANARTELAGVVAAEAAYAAFVRERDRLQAVVSMARTEPQIFTMTDVSVLEAALEKQKADAATRAAWEAWSKLAVVADPGERPSFDHAALAGLQVALHQKKATRPQIKDRCEHCQSPLAPPSKEILQVVAQVDEQVEILEDTIQALELEKAETAAAERQWCISWNSFKASNDACAALHPYVVGGQWVGGLVSESVDTMDYGRRIKDERAKLQMAAVIAERIRLEDEQIAAAQVELNKLVAVSQPAGSGLLSEVVKGLEKSLALAVAEHRKSVTRLNELKSLDAANKARYEAEVVAYKVGVERRAELLDLIAATEKHNALIKKLRLARPVIAAKLWAGLLGAISSTFSTLRGVGSVVGRDSDGFIVDGKPVADLSGSTLDVLGLAVRVNLLRAFLPGVGLLILDEPAAAMDGGREGVMLGTLAGLGLDQVLMVSHSDAAKAVARNVVQL